VFQTAAYGGEKGVQEIAVPNRVQQKIDLYHD